MKALLPIIVVAVLIAGFFQVTTKDDRSALWRESRAYVIAVIVAILAALFAAWMTIYGPAIKLL